MLGSCKCPFYVVLGCGRLIGIVGWIELRTGVLSNSMAAHRGSVRLLISI